MFASLRRFASSPVGALVVFLLIALGLYANAFAGDFVFDDKFFTVRGELRDWGHLWRIWLEPSMPQLQGYTHYRPLTFMTFALNFLIFGESPLSFHVVNVLLNGLACWLFWLAVRSMFGSYGLAWVAALLFALFPIHTEAVAFVKSRDEVLVAVFGFAGILAFLRSVDTKSMWLSAGAALCTFFALASKESAVMLPLTLLGIAILCRSPRRRTLFAPLALQAAAVIAFFALRAYAVGWAVAPGHETLYFGQNPLGYYGPGFAFWTAWELLFIAVAMTVVPWNLSAVYGYQHVPIVDGPLGSWMVVAGVLTAVVLLVLAVHPRIRRTPAGVGAALFLVLYFPFSKIGLVHGVDLFAEHWLYAPSAGLALIAAGGFFLLRRRMPALSAALLCIVFAVYAAVVLARVPVWRSEAALGESMVRDAPGAVHSYAFLAKVRMDQGRLEEAEQLILRGLDISDRHAPLHQLAAVITMARGDLEIAEKAIISAEELSQELATDLLRSLLLAEQDRYEDSLAFLRSSEWFRESDPKIRFLLALNLWKLGRHEEAEAYFDWDEYLPVRQTREEKIRMIEAY